MGKNKKQITAYLAAIHKARQMGVDGTTARRMAWNKTFGTNVKTVYEDEVKEEVKDHDGLVEEEWIENPDCPGEFRISGDDGTDNKIND